MGKLFDPFGVGVFSRCLIYGGRCPPLLTLSPAGFFFVVPHELAETPDTRMFDVARHPVCIRSINNLPESPVLVILSLGVGRSVRKGD